MLMTLVMRLVKTTNNKMPKIKPSSILIILTLVSVAVYAIYNTSGLWRGPVVRIDSPADYSTVPGSVEVKGRIKYVKEASINGKPITFTTKGDFTEYIVLRAPTDTLDIEAVNAYGKRSYKTLTLNVSD